MYFGSEKLQAGRRLFGTGDFLFRMNVIFYVNKSHGCNSDANNLNSSDYCQIEGYLYWLRNSRTARNYYTENDYRNMDTSEEFRYSSEQGSRKFTDLSFVLDLCQGQFKISRE